VLAPGLRAALGAALWAVCHGAIAQTGGSVALLSDYRYRGISLSDEQPTFRGGVAHDGASGWFVGGSIVGVSLRPHGRQLQLIGYLGLTGKLLEHLGWEAGANVVHFGADSQFDYHEWFTGANGERWNVRVHYSPSYFGSGARTAYGELNVGLPLSRVMRTTAHLGGLKRVGGTSGTAERWSLDTAVGLAMTCGAWDFGLEVTNVSNRSGVYPIAYDRVHGVLVLSASYAF
jgi:uncharacterized protein (TIGR02001 family)